MAQEMPDLSEEDKEWVILDHDSLFSTGRKKPGNRFLKSIKLFINGLQLPGGNILCNCVGHSGNIHKAPEKQ